MFSIKMKKKYFAINQNTVMFENARCVQQQQQKNNYNNKLIDDKINRELPQNWVKIRDFCRR